MATSDKYDRQLRLWGAHGQRALAAASILLVGADAVGAETLKNLVLPGVGRFAVLDGALTGDADIGTSFFVHQGDQGRPRAEVVCGYLRELNGDVQGSAIVADPASFPFVDLLPQFSLVVLSNASESTQRHISRLCWSLRVPLIVLSSLALLGSYRVQLRDHDVIEPRIDKTSKGLDLAIARPFPELQEFCDQFQLEDLDFHAHSHVPYVVILRKCMDEWRTRHAEDPRSFAEKEAFKALVRSQARDLAAQTNFQEAVEKSFQVSDARVAAASHFLAGLCMGAPFGGGGRHIQRTEGSASEFREFEIRYSYARTRTLPHRYRGSAPTAGSSPRSDCVNGIFCPPTGGLLEEGSLRQTHIPSDS